MTDLLALVLAGHLIGDWIVQTDAQARDKVWPNPQLVDTVASPRRMSWWANQRHMLGYHLTLAVCLGFAWVAGDPPRWQWALYALAVSWVSHSIIDRRWPVRWLMKHTGSSDFEATSWGVMAVDQALHLSILALLVAVR